MFDYYRFNMNIIRCAVFVWYSFNWFFIIVFSLTMLSLINSFNKTEAASFPMQLLLPSKDLPFSQKFYFSIDLYNDIYQGLFSDVKFLLLSMLSGTYHRLLSMLWLNPSYLSHSLDPSYLSHTLYNALVLMHSRFVPGAIFIKHIRVKLTLKGNCGTVLQQKQRALHILKIMVGNRSKSV